MVAFREHIMFSSQNMVEIYNSSACDERQQWSYQVREMNILSLTELRKMESVKCIDYLKKYK